MADTQGVTKVTDPAALQRLAARSGDVKRAVVAFAESSRFDRWRAAELAKASESAGATGEESSTPLARGSDRWIAAMDDFIMTFRFPDGTGVIDRYLSASGKNLDKRDRKLLEGWRDPVDGIFELRAKHDDSATLFNLLDELDYEAYSEMGFARLPAETADFILARLVPMAPGAWTISGSVTPIPRENAKVVAELALEWLQSRPQLAFRNPEKARLGWEMMREDREDFIRFFGSDQVAIPAAEAESRINDYYRQRQEKALAKQAPGQPLPEVTAGIDRPFFVMPESLNSLDTIGVVFDETDGLSFLPDFGLLEELFASPELAADERYADALLGYLDSGSIYPGVLRRLAVADQDAADRVYRTVLKKPSFTWAKQGDLLLRKRKPWYFKRDRYPGVTPASDYLLELLSERE
ncbi:MAG: hypothetical protein ACRDN0_18905 [Trebonia sp.]